MPNNKFYMNQGVRSEMLFALYPMENLSFDLKIFFGNFYNSPRQIFF